MVTIARRTIISVLALCLVGLVHSQASATSAYTPVIAPCPDDFSLVRQAGSVTNQTLSPGESTYVSTRKSDILPSAWKAYLANVEATNSNLPAYVSGILNGSSQQSPTLGIAQSGGGLRSAMLGAGKYSSNN